MMVEYGMNPTAALKSATSINADAFHINREVGRIKNGLFADILVVDGNRLKGGVFKEDGVLFRDMSRK